MMILGGLVAGVAVSTPTAIALGVLAFALNPEVRDKLSDPTFWEDAGKYLGIPSESAPPINVSNTFTAAARWVQPIRYDPLTLDLGGNGLDTIAFNPAAPVLFDHTGSGMKSGTGWVAPSDGFLALDRNGNGMIDNGTELFGDSTPLDTGGKAADGFAALAQEDSNGDGVVNNLDTNWANLRVWQDLNQDGLSQGNELKTLDELGIASINVGKIEHSSILPNGNEIADLGAYTRTDGSAGGMGVTSGLADINLAADTFHRTFVDTPRTACGGRCRPPRHAGQRRGARLEGGGQPAGPRRGRPRNQARGLRGSRYQHRTTCTD
jgi:hypothetical protein